MRALKDSDGDIWVETLSGDFVLAQEDAGAEPRDVIERCFGPVVEGEIIFKEITHG